MILKYKSKSNIFKFGDIQQHYGLNGKFFIKFTVEGVDDNTSVSISDFSEIKLDSQSKFIS